MINCLLILLFDMSNSSSKGKQKVLIIENLEVVSLLNENHLLAMVVSKHGISKCTIINVKRAARNYDSML